MIRKTPRGGGGGAGGAVGGVGGVGVGPSLSLGAKEPASRKASGLAQLVSALHQNAAAVVNSKTQLNGPDQVRPEPLELIPSLENCTDISYPLTLLLANQSVCIFLLTAMPQM